MSEPDIEHWTRESDLLGEVFEARCPSCGSVCSSIFDQETAVEGAEECCDDGLRADGGESLYQKCALPECRNEIPRAKGICDDCMGIGGGRRD